MARFVVGVILAAVVMSVWGALLWLGPGVPAIFHQVPEEEALADELLAQLRGSGAYLIPWDPDDPEATAERMAEGPLATIHFHRDGRESWNLRILIGGFVHLLISALLLALVLRMVVPALPRYPDRARFVVLFAVAAAVFANLEQPIWWHQSWGFHLVHALYDFGAWLGAGLVLAAFVGPLWEPSEGGEAETEPLTV